jgi:hypothetical protein
MRSKRADQARQAEGGAGRDCADEGGLKRATDYRHTREVRAEGTEHHKRQEGHNDTGE